MKIKVCGMKYPENIKEISEIGPDYMGFIFYPGSKRYAGGVDEKALPETAGITRVAVFVNEKSEEIKAICKKFKINHIQLHGNESPDQCKELKEEGYTVIKVFSVGPDFHFEETDPYKEVADYFLFDTKSENYGGTGKKFDWKLFDQYDNQKEVFLSGGIGPEDAEEIKKIKGLKIHAVDINSCFEKEPGLKNIGSVRDFIKELRG